MKAILKYLMIKSFAKLILLLLNHIKRCKTMRKQKREKTCLIFSFYSHKSQPKQSKRKIVTPTREQVALSTAQQQ